ncbi:unnamed protein product [Ascophyllum nodosum]
MSGRNPPLLYIILHASINRHAGEGAGAPRAFRAQMFYVRSGVGWVLALQHLTGVLTVKCCSCYACMRLAIYQTLSSEECPSSSCARAVCTVCYRYRHASVLFYFILWVGSMRVSAFY